MSGAAPQGNAADLLVLGAELVATVDDQRREIRGGWVAIRDGLISAVSGPGEIPPEATDTISAAGCLVTPGLINTHHHIYQNLTRSFAPAVNGSLFDWLTTLYPIWAGLDEEAVLPLRLGGPGRTGHSAAAPRRPTTSTSIPRAEVTSSAPRSLLPPRSASGSTRPEAR